MLHRMIAYYLARVGITVGAALGTSLPTSSLAADLARPVPSDRAPAASPVYGLSDYLREWHVVIGTGGRVVSEYEGADTFRVQPFPLLSAHFGDRVAVDPRGLTFKLFDTQGLSVAARAGYDFGRKEDASDSLKGLGDIGVGATVGTTIAYQFGPLRVYTSADKIIGGSDGLQMTIGGSATATYDKFVYEAGTSVTWADDKYMNAYFGVSQSQALLSGLPTYAAGAGLKRVDVSAAVTYNMTEHWLIRSEAGTGLLLGDAAHSPVTQDKVQLFGTFALGYKF